MSERLQPVVDQLGQGEAPSEELELPLEGGIFGCRTSVLRKDDTAAGAIMVLRKKT